MLEIKIGRQSIWSFCLRSVSYLLYPLAHTPSSDHLRLLHQSCILQCWLNFLCVCDVRWCTAVSQPFFTVFFTVNFWDFSSECSLHKEAVYVILFFFLLRQTIKCSVKFSSRSCGILHWNMVFFSILVFVSLVSPPPAIRCFVTIFATFVTRALKYIAPVLISFIHM